MRTLLIIHTVLAGVPEMRARTGAGEGGPGVLAGAPRAARVGLALRRARARRAHAAQHGATPRAPLARQGRALRAVGRLLGQHLINVKKKIIKKIHSSVQLLIVHQLIVDKKTAKNKNRG